MANAKDPKTNSGFSDVFIAMALRHVPPIQVADAEMQPVPLQILTEAQLKTRAFIPELIQMHSQIMQNLIKNGSLRTRGSLWVFQDVAQGDFFAHEGWGP